MRTKANKRAARKWIEANPLKHAAHVILATAIKRGKVQKRPCEVCGNLRSHGHHEDYTKPLEVKWLCAKHHKEAHGIFRKPSKPRRIARKVLLQERAIALRQAGNTYAEIGKRLGLSKSHAYKSINPRSYD